MVTEYKDVKDFTRKYEKLTYTILHSESEKELLSAIEVLNEKL